MNGPFPCAGKTHLFFPERGDVAPVREAKAICAACPDKVREWCLDDALLMQYDNFGIRAGLSAKERQRVRRERGIVRPSGATDYDI